MTEDAIRKAVRAELAEYVPPKLYSVSQAASALGIAETHCYSLIGSGRLRSVKSGRRRLIPPSALDEYVAALEVSA